MNNSTNGSTEHRKPLYVVGIGASAGGMEALQSFFTHLDPDSGASYVVVPHLSPDYRSLMADILSKVTSMPVVQAAEGNKVKADHVYVLPPGKLMTIENDVLHLESITPGSPLVFPIDVFFRSLAKNSGEHSVSIVLSGTGSDGSRGIKAIKDAGGLILVQEAGSAQFDGMPNCAISTGLVDCILPPQQMGGELVRFMNYCQSAGPNQLVTRAQTDEETIQKIFRLLHQKFHIDFTQYKQNSILRRIERRMAIHHIGDLHDYYQMLLGDVSEASVLWKEMLINVTRFFRDKEAFEVLKEEVMPRIFHKENQEIRIWVAGCSTGEETYSIAILLREYMESIGRKPAIKIFATDLDKDALDLASLGMYPAGIAADVSPDRLEKYFVKVGDRYQVSKELRKMIVFAHHNLVKDPPFLSIDLVTCRNVLIYFQPILQKKVLSLFHFSLATGGFLFLGASETIGELGKLYAPLHNKWNIFSKRNVIQRRPLNMVEISEPVILPGQTLQGSQIMEDSKLFRKLDDLSQSLIEEFVPPCIIIDDNHDVVHTTGDVNAFLNVPRGKFSHNLFKMVPQTLSVALSTAVHKARNEKSEVIYKNIVMEQNGASRRILLKVKLFRTEKTNDKYILIAFLPDRELEKLAPASSPPPDLDLKEKQFILDLEQELVTTQETLQTVIEQLETSNEELQATNEELIASNEELQSTNEELSSVNEELVTVNSEFQSKIHELIEVNSDMNNFLSASNIGTIFLDIDLSVRRFTPNVMDVINLMEVDVGRPIMHISHNLVYDRMVPDIEEVLRTLVPIEREVQSNQKNWYLLKISPYRTVDHYIKGIIMTLVNITELKSINSQLSKLSLAIEQSPSVVMITDKQMKIEYVNPAFTDITGYPREEVIGTEARALERGEGGTEVYDVLWEKVGSGSKWKGELQGRHKDGRIYWESATVLPVINEKKEVVHYLKVAEDITKKKHTEGLLRKSEMLSVAGQLASGIAHEIRNPLTSVKGFLKLLNTKQGDQEKYMEILSAEVDSMELIINELLLLAKTQIFEFATKDLRVILQNVVMLLSSQAILKNIEFVVECELESVHMNCVENQIKQMFVNLLKNAIEATPYGGQIFIQIRNAVYGKVMIRIVDKGCGIPKEQLDRIGEPFYTTKQKGTGLGLMICHQIIENHQGQMRFQSEVNKGTTIDILLPLHIEGGHRSLAQPGSELFQSILK